MPELLGSPGAGVQPGPAMLGSVPRSSGGFENQVRELTGGFRLQREMVARPWGTRVGREQLCY